MQELLYLQIIPHIFVMHHSVFFI